MGTSKGSKYTLTAQCGGEWYKGRLRYKMDLHDQEGLVLTVGEDLYRSSEMGGDLERLFYAKAHRSEFIYYSETYDGWERLIYQLSGIRHFAEWPDDLLTRYWDTYMMNEAATDLVSLSADWDLDNLVLHNKSQGPNGFDIIVFMSQLKNIFDDGKDLFLSDFKERGIHVLTQSLFIDNLGDLSKEPSQQVLFLMSELERQRKQNLFGTQVVSALG